MLKPRLGETRVTRRKLDCLKSNPIRSMEGLWLQHLTARWTSSHRQADGLGDLCGSSTAQ